MRCADHSSKAGRGRRWRQPAWWLALCAWLAAAQLVPTASTAPTARAEPPTTGALLSRTRDHPSNQPQDRTQDQPQAPERPTDEAQPKASDIAAVPAARQAETVYVLPIRTAIDRFTVLGLRQRLERAQREGAQAVVIELDTPGGEVGAVLEISEMLKTAAVPTVVAWVNRTALSGGAIIALACDDIVTNDPATMGDAIPIQVSQLLGIQQLSEEERQKILAPLLVDLVDSARRNGYDEKLVQGLVSLGVELWLIERTQPGPMGEPVGQRLFIDLNEYRMLFGEPPASRTPSIPSAGTGPSPAARPSGPAAAPGAGPSASDAGAAGPSADQDASAFRPAGPSLARLDADRSLSRGLAVPSQRPVLSEADRGGWRVVAYVADGRAPVTMTSEQLLAFGLAQQVVRDDEALKAYFGARTLVRWEENGWMALARFMANPVVRGLLLVVVLVGFFVEMASPGLGLPGGVALLALIGLLAPAAMVGMAGWWEFAALGLGIVLVLVEVFVVPGLGVPGVIGAVLLFLGLLGTFTGSGGLQTQEELLTGVVVLVLALASAGVIVFLLARNLGRIPGLNRLVLQNVSDQDEPEAPGMLEAMALPSPAQTLALGQIGTAVGTLRPSGRARFGEALVDVVSVGPIVGDGQAVRVVELSRFRVLVEPVEEPADPQAQGQDADVQEDRS
ncbi:MAG: hypothetical protein KatS3mg103_0664 [Phycisphaerales bacterium]|nr:MAG: hypothetical protein KatS3mg103_0664 [Phycisphaerales bacterium]